jgi:hypothetical protein
MISALERRKVYTSASKTIFICNLGDSLSDYVPERAFNCRTTTYASRFARAVHSKKIIDWRIEIKCSWYARLSLNGRTFISITFAVDDWKHI